MHEEKKGGELNGEGFMLVMCLFHATASYTHFKFWEIDCPAIPMTTWVGAPDVHMELYTGQVRW